MEAPVRWNYELYKFILNMTKELKLKGMTNEEFEKWAEKVAEKIISLSIYGMLPILILLRQN